MSTSKRRVGAIRPKPLGPLVYFAAYDDGTCGPNRRTEEQAAEDFTHGNDAPTEVRRAVEHFGAGSLVFQPWETAHPDYRLVDEDGTRRVMALGPGGTVLTTWYGPAALRR